MAAIQKVIVKKLAAQFGIDPDASLPELLESLNDAFDLGLQVDTPAPAEVEAAVVAIAKETVEAMQRDGAKFFLMAANPEGKPPMRAFVIMG